MPNHKKPMRLSVTDLTLELTRRCNMKCPHCLRGDAEDLDMSRQVIENTFSAMREISTLTFTGGEPSLVPELMQYALSMAKKYHVRVTEAYLATNGLAISEKFMAVCRAWHMKCLSDAIPYTDRYVDTDQIRNIIQATKAYEPAGIYIDISMDPYHDSIPLDNVLKLCTLPNVRTDKYRPADDDSWVLHVGRAYWNGIGRDDTESSRPWAYGEASGTMRIEWNDAIGGAVYDGLLYVNAEGKILKYCDYPYDDQDEHVMGQIMTDKLDRGWVQRLYDAHKDDPVC